MILDNFDDYPTKTLYVYAQETVFDPNTGQMTTSYASRGEYESWVFQASSMQRYIHDKIINEVEFIAVMEESINEADLIYFGSMWFSVKSPDDVLHAGEVYLIGMKRAEAPANVSGELPETFVLGDIGGVV